MTWVQNNGYDSIRLLIYRHWFRANRIDKYSQYNSLCHWSSRFLIRFIVIDLSSFSIRHHPAIRLIMFLCSMSSSWRRALVIDKTIIQKTFMTQYSYRNSSTAVVVTHCGPITHVYVCEMMPILSFSDWNISVIARSDGDVLNWFPKCLCDSSSFNIV